MKSASVAGGGAALKTPPFGRTVPCHSPAVRTTSRISGGESRWESTGQEVAIPCATRLGDSIWRGNRSPRKAMTTVSDNGSLLLRVGAGTVRERADFPLTGYGALRRSRSFQPALA